MSSAYHQLLQQCEKHATITLTVSLFGAHFDIYLNKRKLGMVPYCQEDAQRLQAHFLTQSELLTPYMPVERFLKILAPNA